jgi:hypothetical protein
MLTRSHVRWRLFDTNKSVGLLPARQPHSFGGFGENITRVAQGYRRSYGKGIRPIMSTTHDSSSKLS